MVSPNIIASRAGLLLLVFGPVFIPAPLHDRRFRRPDELAFLSGIGRFAKSQAISAQNGKLLQISCWIRRPEPMNGSCQMVNQSCT